MAIRGTFLLDFTQFDQALTTATQHLERFASTGKGVQSRLQQVFNQFDGRKVITEAKLLAAAVEQIGGAARLTDAEMRRVNATVTEAIQKYDRLGKEAPADLRKLAEATRQVAAATDQATPKVGLLGTAMGGLGRSLLAYVGPAAVGAAVVRTGQWAAELSDLSDKTNIATGVLQRLGYAAASSGVPLETATTAVAQMTRLLGDRDKGFVAAVRALNLNFDQLARQDPGQTFLDLAAAIERVEDPYRRAALKQDLFGKSAKELDGFLKDLAQTMREDLPIASDEAIKAADEFDRMLGRAIIRMKVYGAEAINQFARLVDLVRNNPLVFAQQLDTAGQVRAAVEARAQAALAQRPTPAGSAALAISAGFETPAQAALRQWATKDFLEATFRQTTATRENTAALKAHQAALMRTPMTPVSFATLGGPFAPGATLGLTPTLFGEKAGRAIASELVQASERLLPSRTLGGGLEMAPNISPRSLTTGPGFWGGAFGGAGGFGAGLSSTILSSVTGGGSVSQGIGAFLGGGLMSGVVKRFSDTFAGTFLGGALSSILPGLGSLLGPAIGWLQDKLFGGDAKKTRQMREQWLQQAGGIDAVRKMADYAGVSIDRLLDTRKSKVFEAEIKRLEAAFAATQKRVQALVGDLAKVSASGGLVGRDLFARLQADAGKEEVQQALGQFLQQQTSTGLEALSRLAQGPALTERATSALGAAAAALFEQLRQNGATALEALQQIGPAIEALGKKFDDLKIGGGGAFDELRALSALAADEVAGPLLSAVDEVGRLMRVLANTGWINEEMFAGLASQVGATYDQLIAAGKDGSQALRLMQPTLQTLWELQQEYGWAVDETTQALIEEAQTQGLVGEKFKSATDKMVDAVNKLISRLDTLLTRLFGLPAAAETAADGMNDAFDTVQPPKYGVVQPDDQGGVYAARGGLVARLAGGGFPFAASGTDTVPAMLTPGEYVISAGAARALGADTLAALNAGRIPGGSVSVPITVYGGHLTEEQVAGLESVAARIGKAIARAAWRDESGVRVDLRHALGI